MADIIDLKTVDLSKLDIKSTSLDSTESVGVRTPAVDEPPAPTLDEAAVQEPQPVEDLLADDGITNKPIVTEQPVLDGETPVAQTATEELITQTTLIPGVNDFSSPGVNDFSSPEYMAQIARGPTGPVGPVEVGDWNNIYAVTGPWPPEETKPVVETKPKTAEKAYGWAKVAFAAVLTGTVVLVSLQSIFEIPHPKNWHFGLFSGGRSVVESVTIPEKKATIKVIETGKFLIALQKPDGTIEKRTGGSVSWRLHNPGRLTYSKFTEAHGAVGFAGKYAIFPSYVIGRRANEVMLFEDSKMGYKHLSIADAVKKYLEGDSDHVQYTKVISKHVGVSSSTKMEALTAEQKNKFLSHIEELESFVQGRVWPYKNMDEYKRLG